MRGGARHIADDARAVRAALHECLPDVKQNFHLAVEGLVVVAFRILNARCFHRSYRVPFSSIYNCYTL